MSFTNGQIGIFLMAYGAAAIFYPGLIFFLDEGWKFRNAEPSNAFQLYSRIAGVVMLIIGFSMFTGKHAEEKANSEPVKPAAVSTKT